MSFPAETAELERLTAEVSEKEVARLEPENFEAHLDLGICYAQKGFYA